MPDPDACVARLPFLHVPPGWGEGGYPRSGWWGWGRKPGYEGLSSLFSLTLYTLLFPLTPTHATTPTPPPPPPAHHLHGSARTADLPNFHQVAPGIYRGAAPTDKGLAQLKAMGVKTIIDLRIEKRGQAEEAKTTQTLGLRRIRIPLGREAPTTKQVATFLATLNDPAQGPVYVHCQYGADRTGAMIGIYRVTHDHWAFDHTYREMLQYGFKPFLGELKGAVEKRAQSH